MRSLSRREFLQRAAVTGAGVAVLRSPDAYGAAPPARAAEIGVPAPGFAAAQVVQTAGSALIAVDSSGDRQTIRLSPGARVWKQGLINTVPLAVGDSFYASGDRDGYGVLDASHIWVAIVNAMGPVEAVSGQQLTFTPAWGLGSVQATPSPRGTIIHDHNAIYKVSDFSLLAGASYVYLVGYYSQEPPWSIVATRIYTATTAATDASPSPNLTVVGSQSPDVVMCPKNYNILASVECCGGDRPPGYPSSYPCLSGTGLCGTCSSGVYGIAWPNACTTSGACDDYVPSLPYVPCGYVLDVYGICSGKSLSVPVVDADPNPRPATSNLGCAGLTNADVCLTVSAFTALGGGLDYGHLDVEVIIPEPC